MAQKDRKKRKLRGSRTQGWGNAQKHRGAGSRGGRGMAGSKKHKWASVSKSDSKYFGRHGFTRHKSLTADDTVLNVGALDELISKFASEGRAEEKAGVYSVDLSSLGVDKLLGSGTVSNKLKVKVDSATKRAVEKIESAGGSVEAREPAEDEFPDDGVEESTAEVAEEDVGDGAGVPEADTQVPA